MYKIGGKSVLELKGSNEDRIYEDNSVDVERKMSVLSPYLFSLYGQK